MIILSVRTDKPEAEIGLFNDLKKQHYIAWEAHRELSTTLHKQAELLLKSQSMKWDDIDGIIFYCGPGSFTGLRIGAAFANALAQGSAIPLAQANGENWIETAIAKLLNGESSSAAPEYGAEARTTQPKK
jgi:tRNA threonylcarbamoyladenosine biosynthesis protein TsaB